MITDGNTVNKEFGRHSEGNIVGSSATDFIAVPARARISITYVGEAGAEAVFGLRKL